MSVQSFYERLVKLKIRAGSYDVPNLTQFLSYKKSASSIDVQKFVFASEEFQN